MNSWDSLTSFSLYDINRRIWTVFVQAVNKGKLPNLRELRLSIDAASAAEDDDEIVTLFTNVSFLDYHGEIPYRCRDSHKHRIRKSMITIYELEAEKLPYLKSLTLIGRTIVFYENQLVCVYVSMNELHCQKLQNIGDMLAVWDLEYLNLSFNWCIAENLSVLLRHRLPSLDALVLRDCGLEDYDMRHLTQARDQGKLPQTSRCFRELDRRP